MTYDVLKDYEDVVEIPIPGGTETRKEVILSLKAGEKFIPAETHYPQYKVNALVNNGTIRLIGKSKSDVSTPEPVDPHEAAAV